MLSAVAFDLDGTLVDSEPLVERSWAMVLAEFGYKTTDGDFAVCRGLSSPDTEAYFARQASLDDDVELWPLVDDVRSPLLEAHLVAFPDAVTTVQELAMRGIPMGVATASDRQGMELKLALTGLDRYMVTAISGYEMRRNKPAPDVYLAVAEALGVEPTSCLAVEDTDTGADSALAAGMRVVQVRRDGSLSERFAVVSTLNAASIQAMLGR